MPLVPNEDHIEEIVFIVRGRVEGSRIDHYLSKRYCDYSRAFFQKLIKKEKVLIDGKKTKISNKVRAGQEIHIYLPKLEPLHLQPEAIPLDIVYEDESMAVINKAAGFVVHPSRGHMKGTIVNALLYHFEQLSQSDDGYRPGIVHRLDRDTTGLLLVAKNNSSQFKISRQFELRQIEKEYLALVEGEMKCKEGTINLPLGIDPRNRERMSVQHGGKKSETNYRVVKRYPGYTLVHVFPKSGRTHQIRVHLKSQGYPIVADYLYDAAPKLTKSQLYSIANREFSGKDEILLARQALHAWRITLQHPKRQEIVSYCAPLAEDFRCALQVFQFLWPSPKVAEFLRV